MKLYRHPLSGHSHRAQLGLSLLGVPHELVDVDLFTRQHKSPDFLALNPLGQLPVLMDGETVIVDSNAILVYAASRFDPAGTWYPDDPVQRASVQRWLSLAANEVANGPAAARLVTVFGATRDAEQCASLSKRIFALMEGELRTGWLVGDGPTLADIAMYTYVAHAPEGNIDLGPWVGESPRVVHR